MYAERGDAAVPWRSLEAMLRETHDSYRASVLEERKRRVDLEIPLSDREDAKPGDDDYVDPGEYTSSGFEGVQVKLRVPLRIDMRELTSAVRVHAEKSAGAGIFDAASIQSDRETMALYRAFLSTVLLGVRGLEDSSGEYSLPLGDGFTDEDWRIIEDVGLLGTLVHVARALSSLPHDKRKNFGGLPQST